MIDLLFADDMAMVSHQQDGLQRLMDKLTDACNVFGLTISQKKTQVMGQATPAPPCISQWRRTGSCSSISLPRLHYHRYPITGCRAQQVHRQGIDNSQQTYQESMGNNHLTVPIKINVYKACVISTLLYGSDFWSTYSTQEWKLQVFHLRCLCQILGTKWQDKIAKQCSLKSWYSIHIHTVTSMSSMLVGPHLQDGRRAHP